MTRLPFFFFMLFSFCSYGQEAITAEFKRFQIGVNFSPDVAFRLIETKRSDMNWLIELRNREEVPKFAYTAGVNVCYNIKSFVGIETGIQYSNKGYQSKKQDLIFESQLDSLGFWNTTGDYFKYIDEFHYIDIPVKVNFTLGKKKIRFFTSVGLITSVLVQATSTTVWTESGKVHKGTNKAHDNFNRVNLSPMLSLGIDYKINNKMNLRVEPTFRFGVLNITDTPVTTLLYNGGVNLSYYFGL